MATPHSLKLLLDHARKQTDDAAINLGKLNLKQQEAEKTLQLLVEYRENYQSQFMESAGSGISRLNGEISRHSSASSILPFSHSKDSSR